MFRRSRFAIVVPLLVLASTSSFAETGHRSPDFADGLSGGPDYWEVTGVGTGNRLSMRKEPSSHAARMAKVSNGTVLRNLGCKLARGHRWCRIEQPGGSSRPGWVNGRYLRESSGPR